MKPATTYVNVGFWSSVPSADGEPDGTHNRRIEAEVDRLGGRKSLYSTSYYPPDEFWRHYNGPVVPRAEGGLRSRRPTAGPVRKVRTNR